jgi:1,4-dihydroxy-2-naphthoate octaprenyltransferase
VFSKNTHLKRFGAFFFCFQLKFNSLKNPIKIGTFALKCQPMKLKYYIQSFRLRTLPLSISGILVGSACAAQSGYAKLPVFGFALLTTLCLQILSNISNEVGDLEKGTDNDQRLGPIRSAQSGQLTVQNLKNAMGLFVALSVIFGTVLVYVSFGTLVSMSSIIMLLLGVGAIIASIKYTFGKKSYGYLGLGDVFVFIFFGLVSVLGVYYLATGGFDAVYLLPASAIGFLSTGVLNVNNLRDVDNDSNFHKRTMAVRFGVSATKVYHTVLVVGALVMVLVFYLIKEFNLGAYLCFLAVPLFVIHLVKIHTLTGRDLDPQLKVLSLTTLVFSLLIGIGLLYN